MNILLVDDTELFLDLERSYLERESFTFDTARSGEEALAAVRRKKPDLVILDLLMPDMDGDAVCRELKSNHATRDIPVIMLTSTTQDGLTDRCYAAGCDALVAKPLKREDLLQAIEKVILVSRRKHPRIPTHLPSYIRYGDREAEAWVRTISVGGLFIETDPLPEAGRSLEVTFSLPENTVPIRARGQVKWAGRVRAEGALGVGIAFFEIDEKARAAIEEYVERKLSAVGSLKGFA